MTGGRYAVGEEVGSGDEQTNIFEHDISIERLLTKRTPSSGKRLHLQVLLKLQENCHNWQKPSGSNTDAL